MSNLLHRTASVFSIAVLIVSIRLDSFAGVQTSDLAFETADQSMWGPGPGFNLDKTWNNLLTNFSSGGTQTLNATVLGSGLTLDYDYSGRVGLLPRLRVSSGNVGVKYPLRLNASLPDAVNRG